MAVNALKVLVIAVIIYCLCYYCFEIIFHTIYVNVNLYTTLEDLI